MKISLNTTIISGSYGGGMKFANIIKEYLEKQGVTVINTLNEDDIDIILHIVPFPRMSANVYSFLAARKYVKKHPGCLIVHRINECDERKKTKTTNKQLALFNSTADYTIYIASWLIDLFKKQNLVFTEKYGVIKNGADGRIFSFKQKKLPGDGKIKLVTHHWSPNKLKGWDVYNYIDELFEDKTYGDKFEFHYIGNAPKDNSIKNIIFHPPCSGKELAEKISSCHIYLTASVNEPAGMHHVEGAMCGLPLLYRNSGALPEYCQGFGEMFNDVNDFKNALEKLTEQYDEYAKKMKEYNNSSEKMCREYYETLRTLFEDKENIMEQRKKKKNPSGFMLSLRAAYYTLLNKAGIN